MTIKYTDGCDKDFISLCHDLDDFLNEIAGGEKNRSQYIPYNQLDDIHDVVLLYDHDRAIGCASFKKYDKEQAEVKRVFIRSGYRGQGTSIALMKALEALGKEKGYSYFILETGDILTAAMALYRELGYQVIPNYGPYKDLPESICMRKKL